ncbi:shikimate dehydrogenase [Alloscardovia theropitheci]|uniref:shikimate dehydrogenase (NADP(+)) n=1 Tax=Alloscardovia theropitheci TaxID=2496842 RepID=A0A4R0QYB9_9BIFI|nr:shikimate dehydrogenase [Alloscardovia theropitheci]TCD54760.1 shikimate dehydrogenase [Alloscardovia theropitheci]
MTNHHAAVLGYPIGHSLSPVLHNAAYEALGLRNWSYDKISVTENELHGFFESLDNSWAGVSMTMPLKQEALSFGDMGDLHVQHLGVANTAVFDWNMKNGSHKNMPHITLYNTDVDGISMTFADEFRLVDLTHKRVLILGSGSTAMSALEACIEMNATHITLCARDINRAQEKVNTIISMYPQEISVSIRPWEYASQECVAANVIISAVTAHATDDIAKELIWLPYRRIFNKTYLLDVIYDPRPTALMTVISADGGHVRGGEHMLLRQAVAQVAYMTHTTVQDVMNIAFTAMKKALFEKL